MDIHKLSDVLIVKSFHVLPCPSSKAYVFPEWWNDFLRDADHHMGMETHLGRVLMNIAPEQGSFPWFIGYSRIGFNAIGMPVIETYSSWPSDTVEREYQAYVWIGIGIEV